MKTKIATLVFTFISMLTSQISRAQMTAMDFTMVDCNASATHNLYSDLNSGKVVIIEFFMTSCSSCIVAGQTLEAMKTKLLSQYPGKIKAYAFGFNNTYSCTTVNNWLTTNSITSVPSDSGAAQVAYYGGMGMPTIVIAAGTNHKLLGSPYIGFTNSDTTGMATNIRNFLNGPTSVNEFNSNISELNIFPNPTSNEIKITFNLTESSNTIIEIMDITGRVVKTFLNEKMSNGNFTKTFNVSNMDNGNYFININTNGFISRKKISIIH